ncbi:hypothetical protein IPA_06365 [Ignicoccus pacificus DSM 13166]|uniref:Uncharacterized protein n=1 Tax=Ignicoccus pacificus DSM 13166 TaxID=940294 RepID=A0A977PLJ6_9CREN|nr:hypothetical protein IPA_06365 [Ignicoccus pacificus DSM 13166]
MEAEDVVLAILYLNERKGRFLNEKGIAKIASEVGVKDLEGVLESLMEKKLVAPNLRLTDEGKVEAAKALKRLENEVKKGLFGVFKWMSFKNKLAPEKIKGSCLGSPS